MPRTDKLTGERYHASLLIHCRRNDILYILKQHTFGLFQAFGFLCFSIFLMAPAGKPLIHVKPSPFKALSQVLQFPKTRIVETKNGIRGRIERVKTPYIRFAPGLSLKYTKTLPDQQAVYSDGDNQFVLYELREKNDSRFAAAMLSYSGYFLAHQPENFWKKCSEI